MASLGSTPKTWIPYVNIKDCSQGSCGSYCPQWCHIIFPPPAPPFDDFSDDNSSSTFSPLVIAIIGILASAFLLVSYYTLISMYCGKNNNDSSARIRSENQEDEREEFEDIHNNPSLHEPWNVTATGLDEALIKSITMFKYKKGDGLIEGTDCSVCLCEFQEDDNLRLLPTCSHAFHVSCIDTWLKSHSNCPLCRANIAFVSTSLAPLPPPSLAPPPPPPPSLPWPQDNESLQDDGDPSEAEITVQNNGVSKTPLRVSSALGTLQQREIIIEIRRSVSMDHPYQEHVIQSEDFSSGGVGSSKNLLEVSKSSHKTSVLHSVLNPVTMKRSFSSGRFFLTRHGRVHHTISSL